MVASTQSLLAIGVRSAQLRAMHASHLPVTQSDGGHSPTLLQSSWLAGWLAGSARAPTCGLRVVRARRPVTRQTPSMCVCVCVCLCSSWPASCVLSIRALQKQQQLAAHLLACLLVATATRVSRFLCARARRSCVGCLCVALSRARSPVNSTARKCVCWRAGQPML